MSNCMCFYDNLINFIESLEVMKNDMNENIERIRTDGYCEPTLIDMEAIFDSTLSACKRLAVNNFELKVENDEMKLELNEIENLVSSKEL